MATTSGTGLITPDIIAREALMHLSNNLVMGAAVFRAHESEFDKVGNEIRIRKPVKFTVEKARTRASQSVGESSVTLAVSTQAHVSWAFISKDLTMTIEQYSERYIKPAAIRLANAVDSDLCALYKDVHNAVYESTGFVNPSTFMVLAKAAQKLDEEACPPDSRCLVVNPAANWGLANALKDVYVNAIAGPMIREGIGDSGAGRKGYHTPIAGFSVYMDQNIKSHTTGEYHDTGSTASILVATTGGATGTTIELIHLRNVSTVALRDGDVFTIEDCYAVNPVSGESTGELRRFVVTADASCAATATSAIVSAYIYPEIIDTGAYKTVDTIPAAGKRVTLLGNASGGGHIYPQNLAFHKQAFALAMVPLDIPDGVSWGARETQDGCSIRVIKDYSIDTDAEIIRLDILYGVVAQYPELACRIYGAEV